MHDECCCEVDVLRGGGEKKKPRCSKRFGNANYSVEGNHKAAD